MNVPDILANAYVELGRYFAAKNAGNDARAQSALVRLQQNLGTIPLETLRLGAREEVATFVDIISNIESPEYAQTYTQKSLVSFLAPFALHRPLSTQ